MTDYLIELLPAVALLAAAGVTTYAVDRGRGR